MGQQQTFRNCRQVRRQRDRPSGIFVMLGIGSVVHQWDIALLGAMIARQPAHQSVDSTRFKGVKSQRVTTLFIALPDISRNAAGASFCRLMDGVVCQMRVAPATQLRPHRAHHLEGSRLIFQGLGNVLAQQIQCAAAIRAARLFGFQPLGFPGQRRRQRTARRSCRGHQLRIDRRFQSWEGIGSFQFFQLPLELLYLPIQLLGTVKLTGIHSFSTRNQF